VSDIADYIRLRAEDYVENALRPQAAGNAVIAVLDECERLEAHGDARILYIVGRLHALMAEALDVSPLDSPSGDAAGVRSPDGGTAEDGAA
jgi:hypothetical protein